MLERFDRFFVRANRALIGVMMLIMFVLVFLNVLGRYGIGKSWAAAEEISTFLMIWVAYLGAGLALREGRHAAIDMLQDRLPSGLRRGLRTLLGVVIVVFFGVLAWLGARCRPSAGPRRPSPPRCRPASPTSRFRSAPSSSACTWC